MLLLGIRILAASQVPPFERATQKVSRPKKLSNTPNMNDIRMRDREIAEKRAREAAQTQRSAEEDSANSPQGKQPARSGQKGKHTPEHHGGRGRSPSALRGGQSDADHRRQRGC